MRGLDICGVEKTSVPLRLQSPISNVCSLATLYSPAVRWLIICRREPLTTLSIKKTELAQIQKDDRCVRCCCVQAWSREECLFMRRNRRVSWLRNWADNSVDIIATIELDWRESCFSSAEPHDSDRNVRYGSPKPFGSTRSYRIDTNNSAKERLRRQTRASNMFSCGCRRTFA